MKELIKKVTERQQLTADEAEQAVRIIARDEANEIQTSAFLAAHITKGSAADEIVGFVRALRKYSEKISPVVERGAIDTSGTGGGPGTFNISTAASFVAAAADIPVAKQGIRSIWSLAGGADVLEALGVEIKLTPTSVEQMISEIGIGFLYAPLYHSVLRHIFMLEQTIGVKSLFHTLVVPFTNPAGVRRHLLGIGNQASIEMVKEVVKQLDYEHVMIVRGDDGVDEISITAPTQIIEVKGEEIERYTISPEDFGFPRASLDDVKDAEPDANARTLRDVLSGLERGPKRHAVLLNAAGALVVGGKADTLKEGVAIAAELIDDGWAEVKLHELVEVSRRLPKLRTRADEI